MIFKTEDTLSAFKVISRGWLNAQNRFNAWSKVSLQPGEFYSYSIEMITTDYILKKGNKLKLILYGTDAEAAQRPLTVTKISIDEASIDVSVPFVL